MSWRRAMFVASSGEQVGIGLESAGGQAGVPSLPEEWIVQYARLIDRLAACPPPHTPIPRSPATPKPPHIPTNAPNRGATLRNAVRARENESRAFKPWIVHHMRLARGACGGGDRMPCVRG